MSKLMTKLPAIRDVVAILKAFPNDEITPSIPSLANCLGTDFSVL